MSEIIIDPVEDDELEELREDTDEELCEDTDEVAEDVVET